MDPTPRSPFAGWPETERDIDANGRSTFTVRPVYLTPQGAKAAGPLATLTALAVMVFCLLGMMKTRDAPTAAYLLAMFGPWLFHWMFVHLWCALLTATTEIVLSAARFSVRRGGDWEHYDRTLPHRFALVPHDKARAEREFNDFRRQAAATEKRKAARTYTWYGESWHLSFDYLGQRNDVLTIYGRPAALALRDRLKACDDVLDAETRKGGVALSPAQEWGEQPGDIPSGA